ARSRAVRRHKRAGRSAVGLQEVKSHAGRLVRIEIGRDEGDDRGRQKIRNASSAADAKQHQRASDRRVAADRLEEREGYEECEKSFHSVPNPITTDAVPRCQGAIRARAFPSASLLLTSRNHPSVLSKYDNL